MSTAGQGRTPETQFWLSFIAVAKNPTYFEDRVLALESAQAKFIETQTAADEATSRSQAESAQVLLDRDAADKRIADADEYAAAAKRDVQTARDQAAGEAAAVTENQRLESERLKTWDEELKKRARDLDHAQREANDLATHAGDLAEEHKAAIAQLQADSAAANERERVAKETVENLTAALRPKAQ